MLPCVRVWANTDVLLREDGNTQPEIAELTGSPLSKLGARQQRRGRPKIETTGVATF